MFSVQLTVYIVHAIVLGAYLLYTVVLLVVAHCISTCIKQVFTAQPTQIEGTDFFDRDSQYNKLFPAHNHVIIPYCSSDLWLGDEQTGPECNCFNFTCFDFNPSSEGLQFTFRGKKIFQSIIRQLMSDHGMGDATEVVLAGSSAGGVGVVNHAQWVRKQLLPNAELLVIFESAWFINFQGSIEY